ncbi:MAG: hypothetical protein EBR86_12060 [Planctomycetia bacterium]|nr:hypothetical protein [Planctomycetia bacterium]
MLVWLAPVSGGRWKVALEGIGGARGRISLDPHSTAASLRQLLLGLGVAVVVADLGRVTRWRRWLLGALAVSAVVIVGTGLAFPVRKGDGHKLLGWYLLDGPLDFWRSPVVEPVASVAMSYPLWMRVGDQRYEVEEWVNGDGFGSYVDTNKFAGGVYLTVPVLCGMLVWMARRWLPGLSGVAAGALAASAVLLGAGWVTGRMAGSRAGTAALLLGALVLAAVAVQSRWARWLTGGIAAAAATAILVGLLVLHGPLRGLEKFLPERVRPAVTNMLGDGRAEAARVANRMFRASPLLGTGLGTYRGLHPRLLPDSATHWAFAHDDVDQWLAETGLVGLLGSGALLTALGISWRRWRRVVPASEWAWSAGVWAALAGLAVHSFFDWNLHLPANAFLAAVLVGLALSAEGLAPVGSSAKARGKPAVAPPAFNAAPTILGVLLAIACAVSVGFVWRDVGSAAVVRQLREALVAVRRADLAKPPQPLPEETLRAALAAGVERVGRDPGHPDLPLVIGQVQLHLAAAGDETARAAAEEAFLRARKLSALCQGLPEALSPPEPRRSGR